jgi:hypothetical protein
MYISTLYITLRWEVLCLISLQQGQSKRTNKGTKNKIKSEYLHEINFTMTRKQNRTLLATRKRDEYEL